MQHTCLLLRSLLVLLEEMLDCFESPTEILNCNSRRLSDVFEGTIMLRLARGNEDAASNCLVHVLSFERVLIIDLFVDGLSKACCIICQMQSLADCIDSGVCCSQVTVIGVIT